MLYTGNANRFLLWIATPIVLVFYLIFRFIEWKNMENENLSEIANHHYLNLRAANDFNCLILGGSNSMFSISAEYMTVFSDLNCYNLSLAKEGFSDFAYFSFLENAPLERAGIRHIFYSTFYPLSAHDLAERLESNQKQTPISGSVQFKLFGRSIASYMKNWLLTEDEFFPSSQKYPLPLSNGDFNFAEYESCDSRAIKDTLILEKDTEVLVKWVSGQIDRITNIFPAAQTHLVLPSTLQENYKEADLRQLAEILGRISNERSVIFIEQSPFQDRSVLCDATHHANSLGRGIRTQDLLSKFKKLKE